jgi:NAD(P)-dependent dehydrogenase (short-subunit alcohol dehydrogenase family)
VSSGDARLVIVPGGSRGICAAVARLAGVRGYAVAVNCLLSDGASYTTGAILEIGGGR